MSWLEGNGNRLFATPKAPPSAIKIWSFLLSKTRFTSSSPNVSSQTWNLTNNNFCLSQLLLIPAGLEEKMPWPQVNDCAELECSPYPCQQSPNLPHFNSCMTYNSTSIRISSPSARADDRNSLMTVTRTFNNDFFLIKFDQSLSVSFSLSSLPQRSCLNLLSTLFSLKFRKSL